MDWVKVNVEDDDKIPIEKKYEFLDHTADVQIHAWGNSLKESFEQAAMAMSAYMTDIETVFIEDAYEIEIKEPYIIIKRANIISFDTQEFKIKVRCCGEEFNLDKHPQGTEIKAITFSNMQIHEKEVFVIIDI